MYPPLTLYIDGEFIDGTGRTEQDVINPATLEVVGRLPRARAEDLDRTLAAAQLAFDSWRRTSPLLRSDILREAARLTRERAAEIGRNITLDQGKPLAEAIAEVSSSAEHIEWSAEEGRRLYGRVIPARRPDVRQFVVREPVGVSIAFTPWNFPFSQAIRKVAAALAAGCTVVLKGPQESPSAIVALARIFHDAGLPKGALNIVWGNSGEISEHLIASPIVQKVSFTGSVPIGKQLAALAGKHMKRTTMELGGHAPVLVFDDADVERAATMLAQSKIRNAGQVCVSPSRFFIQRKAYDKFVACFSEQLGRVRVGNGLEADTQMGPLANGRRVAAMEAFVEDGLRRRGEILTGGARWGHSGFFFPPTVVAGLEDDALLMQEEPFGPVMPVVRFDDVDEVLRRANALPFGLASYVFTESLKTAHRVSSGLQAGMVNINHFGMGPAEIPFGGIKDSGMGSEGGTEMFDGYVATKFITQM